MVCRQQLRIGQTTNKCRQKLSFFSSASARNSRRATEANNLHNLFILSFSLRVKFSRQIHLVRVLLILLLQKPSRMYTKIMLELLTLVVLAFACATPTQMFDHMPGKKRENLLLLPSSALQLKPFAESTYLRSTHHSSGTNFRFGKTSCWKEGENLAKKRKKRKRKIKKMMMFFGRHLTPNAFVPLPLLNTDITKSGAIARDRVRCVRVPCGRSYSILQCVQ